MCENLYISDSVHTIIRHITVGLSKSYMELDIDKIKDTSDELVDYIE